VERGHATSSLALVGREPTGALSPADLASSVMLTTVTPRGNRRAAGITTM
jgi:hypothetical protein